MKQCPSCQATYPANYTHCPTDGITLLEISDWAEGSLVRGKYQILAKIGQGGMATVYKAVHTRFGELRALKVINPELARDDNFLRRFEKEAIITRKLQHPNAVRVDDIDEAEDGRPFIVMEYIEGHNLKDVIRREAPLPVEHVCSVVKQVAAALDAAHALGMVHRDIKPANIVLVPSSTAPKERTSAGEPDTVRVTAKVLDFGIAKIRESHLEENRESHMTLTSTGSVIGTPAYMSPEQAKGLRGEQLDGRSDIYSLGVVMYQMLTGILPLKADSTIELIMAHINKPPQPILEARPDLRLPEAVAALVMRCLRKERDDRPSGGRALIEEIDAALGWTSEPEAVTPGTAAAKTVTAASVDQAAYAATPAHGVTLPSAVTAAPVTESTVPSPGPATAHAPIAPPTLPSVTAAPGAMPSVVTSAGPTTTGFAMPSPQVPPAVARSWRPQPWLWIVAAVVALGAIVGGWFLYQNTRPRSVLIINNPGTQTGTASEPAAPSKAAHPQRSAPAAKEAPPARTAPAQGNPAIKGAQQPAQPDNNDFLANAQPVFGSGGSGKSAEPQGNIPIAAAPGAARGNAPISGTASGPSFQVWHFHGGSVYQSSSGRLQISSAGLQYVENGQADHNFKISCAELAEAKVNSLLPAPGWFHLKFGAGNYNLASGTDLRHPDKNQTGAILGAIAKYCGKQ